MRAWQIGSILPAIELDSNRSPIEPSRPDDRDTSWRAGWSRPMNQNLTHALLTRTAIVEKRLMVMAQEHDKGQKPAPQLMKSALRDLGEALEELRVATEQLQLAADDIAVARRESTVNADRYRELYETLPVACLMTNEEGCVVDANLLASKLLNVSGPHLSGKPLL